MSLVNQRFLCPGLFVLLTTDDSSTSAVFSRFTLEFPSGLTWFSKPPMLISIAFLIAAK